MKTLTRHAALAFLVAGGLVFLMTGCSSGSPEEPDASGSGSSSAAAAKPGQGETSQPSDVTTFLQEDRPVSVEEGAPTVMLGRRDRSPKPARNRDDRQDDKPGAMAGSKGGGKPTSGGGMGGDKPIWEKALDYAQSTFAKVKESPPMVLYAGLAAAAALIAFGGFLMIRKSRLAVAAG